MLFLALLSACDEPCLDLCQQYEAWIDRCGVSWETALPDEGWHTIEDCYADQEDAGEDEAAACTDEADAVSEDSCY